MLICVEVDAPAVKAGHESLARCWLASSAVPVAVLVTLCAQPSFDGT